MAIQILPQKTSISSEIGQALAPAIAKGAEQSFYRNQIKDALQNLNLPEGATGFDVAKALISSTAGIPGAERYVGQLFPLLLQENKNLGVKKALEESFPSEGQGIPGPDRELGFREMEEIANRNPAYRDEILATLQNRNEAIRNERNLYREELGRRSGVTDPADLAVMERFASRPEFAKMRNPTLKADAVSKYWQKYESTRNAFRKEAAVRPPPALNHRDYENKIKTIRAAAKPLIEAGQYDEAHSYLAEQGWSENEIAKSLNPLPPEVKKNIDALPKANLGELLAAQKTGQYSKTLERIEDTIAENITPGEVDPLDPNIYQPGTSLIELRAALQKKGIQYDEFDRMMSRMIQDGRVQLDPRQQREFELMIGAPNRVYSIWETLFPPGRK